MRFLNNTTVDKISLSCLQHIIFRISRFLVVRNGEFNGINYLFLALFWEVNVNRKHYVCKNLGLITWTIFQEMPRISFLL